MCEGQEISHRPSCLHCYTFLKLSIQQRCAGQTGQNGGESHMGLTAHDKSGLSRTAKSVLGEPSDRYHHRWSNCAAKQNLSLRQGLCFFFVFLNKETSGTHFAAEQPNQRQWSLRQMLWKLHKTSYQNPWQCQKARFLNPVCSQRRKFNFIFFTLSANFYSTSFKTKSLKDQFKLALLFPPKNPL